MAHPNEDLVREAYAAFGRGDMDALRDKFFTQDVRYHVTDRSLLAGDYEGVDQVLQFFARIFEMSGGTFSFELHDVLANDEHAVALVTVRGERAAKQLNDNMVQTSHLRDGKAFEVWNQATDQYAQDEFWS